MSTILGLISIARKAGKLEVGEEPTVAAARAHQSKLILVAEDAADNTYRRVRNVGSATNAVWVSVPFTKSQLGAAVGRDATAMMAVMDIGLAAAVMRTLAESDPEKYAEASERMQQRNDKAQRRLEEKRQHEKNLKNGKYRAQKAKEAAEAAAEVKQEPAKKEAPAPTEAHKGYKPYHKSNPRNHTAKTNHSGRPRHGKGSGRSNRYEEFGPTGRPPRRKYRSKGES